MRSMVTTGDRIAYSQAFLRQIGGTRDVAQRRGRIVATAGQTFTGVTHWRTGAELPCGADLVYVQWEDQQYPVTYDDGELHSAHAVRVDNVCRLRSAAFAS